MNARLWFMSAVAEGGAYGAKEAGGNSFSYWFLALVFAGSAAFAAAAPHTVGLQSHFCCAASCTRRLLVAVLCSYWFLALVFAGTAAFTAATPHTVGLQSHSCWAASYKRHL